MQQRAQIPVQCPVCNWQHFVEAEVEEQDLKIGAELRKHLEAWIATRCPDHLLPIMELSRN
jgi:hypothetical protein